MSNDYIPEDYQARKTALKTQHSFIVQAPAGAGKTALLTQRFLNLLSVVEHPESIIAITFTRKAAGEMRERILSALKQAQHNPQPEVLHEAQTWRLAQAVIERDKEKNWGLMNNPARLRVQTFDSLSAWLAGQMPLLSEFGSRPNTLEDASSIYADAALNTINQLKYPGEVADSVAILLAHLDNKVANLIHLLATMLARRDQWLRHVADRENPQLTRAPIENALENIVLQALTQLDAQFPQSLTQELLSLIRFAADNLGQDSPFYCCRNLLELPELNTRSLPQWQGIAAFVLTQKGDWRSNKGITKRIGFPAQDKDKKQRMIALLDALKEQRYLRERLADLDRLPAFCFNDSEWQVLNALFILLRYAVLELKLAFQSHGQVDFAEISLKSLYALGRPDEPTELLLKLDYQIRHLLVDEFQDTSINQFQLLEKLTSGWENGDGRSLFLVGDPMQSIYRFREAEVGLFLRAKNQGIGAVQLEFLRLSVNFRSQAGIIDWVNQSFPRVLPTQDDIFMGAVSYAPSKSAKSKLPGLAVHLHAQIQRNDQAEAEQVVKIIRSTQNQDAQNRIAILVSGRSHLKAIVQLLRQQRIAYNAVKIDALCDKPVVKDLLALTLALLHLDDRIHWLAILRAPWCGLNLADLLLIAENQKRTIYAALDDKNCLQQISAEGQSKVHRVTEIIQAGVEQRNRKPLRDWIEGTWIALGGPALLSADADPQTAFMNAEEYFRLLEKLDQGGEPEDYYELEKQVALLYAQSDPEAGKTLQIMTIHAAKGLEFDTVIIPGMGRSPGKDQQQLLYWLESNQNEGSQLLFAPMAGNEQKMHGEDGNKTAQYIKRLEVAKRHLETSRLLYVGVTRAKQNLHLFGHANINAKEELSAPPAGSLLASLWSVVEEQFNLALEQFNQHTELAATNSMRLNSNTIRQCLCADWTCPAPAVDLPSLPSDETEINNHELPEFNWASDIARHVGTVVHRILEHLAQLDDHLMAASNEYLPIAKQLLAELGLNATEREVAADKVMLALKNTLSDEIGCWILSNQHQQAACELALSIVEEGEIRHIIIDRTFVDTDGVRWIIDYKTGSHSGAGLENFLQEEQRRYQDQLKRYAKAMQKMHSGPVKMALYFPLLMQLREIQ